LIPFDHKFEGEHRIENFGDKFLLPELPGILAWAVRGFLRMQEEGMKPPDIVMSATQEYKSAEDGVGAFWMSFASLMNGRRFRFPICMRLLRKTRTFT